MYIKKLLSKANQLGKAVKTDDWRDRTDIKRITHEFTEWLGEQERKILEIGPLDKPLFHKDEFNVKYIDYFSVDQLKNHIRQNKNRNLDNIVELDYVLQGKKITETVEEEFDVVVASHVIEHVPNLFGWFRDIESILTENGELFLVIPDKRYTFDIDRPPTSLGQLIENDLMDVDKPSLQSVFDQRYYHKNVSSHKLWQDYENHRADTAHTFTIEQSLALMNKAKSEYVDCHCNLLASNTFEGIISASNSMGMHKYSIKKIIHVERPYLDFIVQLELGNEGISNRI